MNDPTTRDRVVDLLMVEDNPADVEMTRQALRECAFGHRLHVVETGEDAMLFLAQEGSHATAPRPDLVLLDVNLPGMTGLEVLKAIKEDDDLRRIPVVILTSSMETRHVRIAQELFVDLYIAKGATLREFLENVLAIKSFWASYRQFPLVPE